jgi:hypothetical protein
VSFGWLLIGEKRKGGGLGGESCMVLLLIDLLRKVKSEGWGGGWVMGLLQV